MGQESGATWGVVLVGVSQRLEVKVHRGLQSFEGLSGTGGLHSKMAHSRGSKLVLALERAPFLPILWNFPWGSSSVFTIWQLASSKSPSSGREQGTPQGLLWPGLGFCTLQFHYILLVTQVSPAHHGRGQHRVWISGGRSHGGFLQVTTI